MSRRPKWLKLAEELLEVLSERPEDAEHADERLEWSLQETLSRFVTAATLRPEGVKVSTSKDWPRMLADVPITGWVDAAFIAEMASVTDRTVRNWESRGLPCFGSGKSKRFPTPQATNWALGYRLRHRREGSRVENISVELAMAEAALQGAEISEGVSFRRY